MAKRKKVDAEGNEVQDVTVKVQFLKLWSSDRGLFRPDDDKQGKHELPEAIAESLYAEGVVELL